MKRGESEVARTIRGRLRARFRRGKIFFTERATNGISIWRVARK